MTHEVADEALLARYVDGDLEAFGVLLGRYEKPVFRFVVRYLRDHQLAEDVHQEVFVRVIRGAATFKRAQKFGPWLFRIARNLCIDTIRREGYRKAVSLSAPVGGSAHDPASATLGDTVEGGAQRPDAAAEALDTAAALQRALDELPDDQRELVLLKEISGLTFKEAAVVLGVPESTLKSRMQVALESLRKSMNRRRMAAG
ncbi:MAG: sigma-70 family RNA polymerase sigma factor [Planctomycetota bacterium]